MSIGSATAFLLWSILSCFFLAFLFCHLWRYDRFQCVCWNSGRQPGTFKRVMTYSYLATVPLLAFFNITLTIIKFREGFIVLPGTHEIVIPKPTLLWSEPNRVWVLPLYLIFSVAWSFEIVTHLEELAFWLFLLHQGPSQRNWFRCWEYRAWCIGSIISIIGLPLTSVFTRKDFLHSLAWIFLVGSCASTFTTLCFLYVLARFPGFLREVKSGGAGADVLGRLTTFYKLNVVRVVLRFMFTLPLLTLAVDALYGSHVVVSNIFRSDFLIMLSGFGCVLSSTITLFIFFPLAMDEPNNKERTLYTHTTSGGSMMVTSEYTRESYYGDLPLPSMCVGVGSGTGVPDEKPAMAEEKREPGHSVETSHTPPEEAGCTTSDQTQMNGAQLQQHALHHYCCHHRRLVRCCRSHAPVCLGEGGMGGGLSGKMSLHPYVLNFTSPIDLSDNVGKMMTDEHKRRGTL